MMNKKTPRRIAIIGNPGSGKSTFATRLGKLLNIPAHHLDTHVFVNGKKTDQQKLIKIQQELVDQDSWIIEGCSISTLEMRFSRADAVICLKLPRIFCVWRVFKRLFTLDETLSQSGCAKIVNWTLLKYIWNFEKEKSARIDELREQYPTVDFKVFQRSRDVKKFLNQFLIRRSDGCELC